MQREITCPSFHTAAQHTNPSSLSQTPKALPLHHCATVVNKHKVNLKCLAHMELCSRINQIIKNILPVDMKLYGKKSDLKFPTYMGLCSEMKNYVNFLALKDRTHEDRHADIALKSE